MPTYEYRCDACGHAFEKFQSIKSDPVRKCPKCGKNKVRRLISSGAGLIFKGSGFYITDYRDKSYADKAKADSGTSTPAEGKSDSKSDTKPAETKTKSEATPAKSESKSESKSEPKPESKSSKKKK